MKNLYLILISLSVFHAATAQNPEWNWVKPESAIVSGLQTLSPVINGTFYATGNFRGTQAVFGSQIVTVPDSGQNFFVTKYDTVGNVIWAKGGSDYGYSIYPECITADLNGNVYVTGIFGDTVITFGAFTLHRSEFSSGYFVVKYDPSGNVLWAQGAGSSGPEAWSMCVDANSNLYVTGQKGGSIAVFGNDTVSGSLNYFIVKYDSQGNVVWTAGADAGAPTGGSYIGGYQPIGLDSSGNLLVSVWFSDTSLTFGNVTVQYPNYISGQGAQGLVKYDAQGNVLWAEALTGITAGQSLLNVQPDGWFYMLCNYNGTIALNNSSITDTNTNGYSAVFLAKFISAGQIYWIQNIPEQVQVQSMTTDINGNIYIGGNIKSTFYFGPDTIICTLLDTCNPVILKYDALGTKLWAKSATGNYNYFASGLTVDANNNVYIDGDYRDTALFACNSIVATSINSMYVARLGPCTTFVPVITISGGDTLTAGTFGTYQWFLNDTPVANATNSYFVASQSGNYMVEVNETCGCGGTSAPFLFTGISTVDNAPNIKLYPNPGNGSFYLVTEKCIGANVIIYDALGNRIASKVIMNNNELIDLTRASQGIYELVIEANGAAYSQTIVLQR